MTDCEIRVSGLTGLDGFGRTHLRAGTDHSHTKGILALKIEEM